MFNVDRRKGLNSKESIAEGTLSLTSLKLPDRKKSKGFDWFDVRYESLNKHAMLSHWTAAQWESIDDATVGER